jgi:hypothetical protein
MLISPLFYQDAQIFDFPAPLSYLGVPVIGVRSSRYIDSMGEECFFILCARLRPASKRVKEYLESRGTVS